MMRRFSRTFITVLAVTTLTPNLAHAALTLAVSPTDLSLQYLSFMFGVVSGVLHGSGTQIFAHMFGIFNSALLALGGIVIGYTFIVSTLNTAQEGEAMGKEWSSIWIPIRSAMGIALLLPKGTGYSAIQVFMMWVIVQGIGAADRLWETTLDYLAQGGVLIQQSAVGFQGTPSLSGGAQANAMYNTAVLFIDSVCLQSYQANLASYAKTHPNLPAPPNVYALIMGQLSYYQNLVSNGNGPTSVIIGFPWVQSPPTQLANDFPGAADYGIPVNPPPCGQMTITLPANAGTANEGNRPLALARMVAAQQMVLDLQSPGAVVQDTYTQHLNTSGNLTSYPSLGFTTCPPANSPQIGTGSAVEGAGTCGTSPTWGNGLLPPDLFQNVLSDYIGIVYAAAQTEGGGTGSASIAQNVVQNAKNDGWLMAGRYYIDLVNANNNANGFANAWGSSFPIQVTSAQFPAIWGGILTPSGNSALIAINKYVNGATTYYTANGNIGTMSQKVNQGIAGAVAGIVSIAAIAAPFLIPIITGIIDIFLGMGDLLTSQQTNMNPITAIAIMGGGMMNVAVGFFITGAIAAFALGIGMGAIPCVDVAGGVISLIEWVAPLMTGLAGIMFTTGAMMAYYIPLIPFMLFTFAAIGWLGAVLEAMIAAPLVALGIAHPEGNQHLGKGEHAVMLIANIFLKPSLMLFGFIAGISLSYVGIWILNRGFMGAFYATISSMLTQGTVIGSIFALIGIPLASVCFYTITAMVIVQKAFALIHIVPDRVLKWIGGSVEGHGGDAAQMERETHEGMQKAYQAQGEMVQKGAEGLSSAASEAKADAKEARWEDRKKDIEAKAAKEEAAKLTQADDKKPGDDPSGKKPGDGDDGDGHPPGDKSDKPGIASTDYGGKLTPGAYSGKPASTTTTTTTPATGAPATGASAAPKGAYGGIEPGAYTRRPPKKG